MRQYNAHWYHYRKANETEFVKNHNTSCWRGIHGNTDIKDGEIYIDEYKEPKTEFGIPFLVETINEITPCSIVKIGSKEYIKYKLIGIYDKDLILLNFIRNLWYPLSYGIYENANKLVDYVVYFFNHLIDESIEDPMERLTTAHVKAMGHYTDDQIKSYKMGHSNFYFGSKIRDIEAFKKWDGKRPGGWVAPSGNSFAGEVAYFMIADNL